MSIPMQTKTGRKISEDLTLEQACFAVWLSGEGQNLIDQSSITECQKISKLLEVAFYAGFNSVDTNEIRASAGRSGFIEAYEQNKIILLYHENIERRADEYADGIRQGGAE